GNRKHPAKDLRRTKENRTAITEFVNLHNCERSEAIQCGLSVNQLIFREFRHWIGNSAWFSEQSIDGERANAGPHRPSRRSAYAPPGMSAEL
ncbi:hypothetical protein, partial [Rhodobium orientis]|uniref:hypothetical protein n=1 Tax=Rhodobium orientis TaxID=34017 RepID=UPI001AED4E47